MVEIVHQRELKLLSEAKTMMVALPFLLWLFVWCLQGYPQQFLALTVAQT
jgi:hypothetical protein